MMLITGTVSLAFAAARAAQFGMSSKAAHEFWIPLTIGMASVAGVAIVSTLPAAALTLGLRRLWLGLTILAAYAVSAWLIAAGVGWLYFRLQLREVFLVQLPTLAGFALALTAPLLVARGLGYRLAWGRDVLPEIGKPPL